MEVTKEDVKQGLIRGLEEIAVEVIKKQIMAELVKSAPWLFGKYVAWLTNPIVGFILDSFLSFVIKQTVLGLSLAWISFDIQYEVSDAEEAIEKLKKILADPGKYTEQQIQETEAQFDEKVVDLIRIKLATILP